MEAPKGMGRVSKGLVLSLVGGSIILISGLFSGCVGWGAYRAAFAIFVVAFSTIPQLFCGTLVVIGAIAHKRFVVFAFSIISILWFLYFAIMNICWASYLLLCLLGAVGGIFGIFGGLLLGKKRREEMSKNDLEIKS